MKNSIIAEQLKKVNYADLTNFNKNTSTYFIKKRIDIKIQEDHCYLIHLKSSAFRNVTIATNWNAGNYPPAEYLKVDINKKLANMIKVVGVVYDNENKLDTAQFWNGWIATNDLEVIKEI